VDQEFLRRPLTAALRVQSHYNPFGISDGHSGTVTGFRSSALIRFVPVGSIPPVFHTNSFVCQRLLLVLAIDSFVNLLKPTGYVLHQQFNIQQLYALPTLYLCVLYLSEKNSDLCHLQHKLIGFYNRVEKCLLRGTDWVFK